MDSQGFQTLRRRLMQLNAEGLGEVVYLEELLDDFAVLLDQALNGGEDINPWGGLSDEGVAALHFLQRMINQLDLLTTVGGSFDSAFWAVGDGCILKIGIPELDGKTLGDITADLVELDQAALFYAGEDNNPGGYILAPQAVTAYQVLTTRFQPEIADVQDG